MRPVIVKAYGAFSPATEEVFLAVYAVLKDWYIPEAVELKGDMVRISYEGDSFPAEEVVDALRPFLCEKSEGKLDILDIEAWTLHRYFFDHGLLRERKATLDKALEACAAR